MSKIKSFLLLSFVFAFSNAKAAVATIDSSGYFNSSDGTKIYFETRGSGYPVVLIHGFISTGESWKRSALYRSLQEAGYKVITLDMRGNGRSGKPHQPEAYANDAEAKDIMGLTTSLGIRSYNITGYSRGSIIAARLLVLDKRVNKAVLGGMGIDFTNPEWPRRKNFYRALMGDSIQELQPMVKRIQQDAGLDQLALAYLQKEQPSTPKEELQKVKQPVLVICGEADSDNGNAQSLAALFPHATYAQVPGDHGAAMGTKEFAEKVVSFFDHLPAQNNLPARLTSPVLFQGDGQTAYRDPAVLFYRDQLYLFFTLVETEGDGKVYSYTAMSTTKDLTHWSATKILTPKDQKLDFSSPGNVVRFKGEWVLCLQTYPRPDYTVTQGPRFGNGDARLYAMRSHDLEHWGAPELLQVKGPDVSFAAMGRMIDPYLLEDKDEPGKWWCFYKQNGVSMSYSHDLKSWTYTGHTESGENACVLIENGEYILFHSPKNGIAIKRSADLKNWSEWGGLITLGQSNWPWARGRITAGAVLNLTKEKGFGQYLMFFHGSGPLTEEQGDFDKNSSIGIAWSNDLVHWNWPGKPG